MIGLVMLGSILNYLTRSTLSVAPPVMLHELHITAADLWLHRTAWRIPGRHSRGCGANPAGMKATAEWFPAGGTSSRGSNSAL
jgi:hypothetical protein